MYKPGALRVAMKLKDAPMVDSTEPDGYDTDFFNDKVPLAYLDHSCDEWVIGGAEQIRALVADLQKALAGMDPARVVARVVAAPARVADPSPHQDRELATEE